MAMATVEVENNNGREEILDAGSRILLGGSRWWEIEGPVPGNHDNRGLTRNWFPQEFIFGTGTAAFQVLDRQFYVHGNLCETVT